MKRNIFFFLLAICVHHVTGKTLVFSDQSKDVFIGPYCEYLSSDRTATLNDVLTRTDWIQSDDKVLNFGLSQRAYWLKFELDNQSSEDELYLEVALPYLDHFEVIQRNDSQVFRSVSGDRYSFDQREIKDSYPVIRFSTKKSDKVVYVKAFCSESFSLPVQIKTAKQYVRSREERTTLFGLYTGVFLTILVVSVTLLFILRVQPFFSYTIYILIVYFTQTAIVGHQNELLFKHSLWLTQNGMPLFSFLVGPVALLFARNFLELRTWNLRYNRILILFILAYGFVPIIFFTFPRWSFLLISILNSVGSILVLLLAVEAIRIRKEQGVYLLVAWSVFLSGVILYVLQSLGLLQYSLFTTYMMPAGTIIEALFLALILGYRIRRIEKEKAIVELAMQEFQRIISELNRNAVNRQIESLKVQMNPHFISNTLTSAYSSSLRAGDLETATLLLNFSQLIRTSMYFMEERSISIEEEVEFLKKYLETEKQRTRDRFDYRVKVIINLPEETDDMLHIPPLLIQPALENAVKHAFTEKSINAYVDVLIEVSDFDAAHVTISDNGQGINAGMKKKRLDNRRSVGIDMLRKRIQLLRSLGNPSEMSIIDRSTISNENGTIFKLVIPLI